MRARLLISEAIDKETSAILIGQIAEQKFEIGVALRHGLSISHG